MIVVSAVAVAVGAAVVAVADRGGTGDVRDAPGGSAATAESSGQVPGRVPGRTSPAATPATGPLAVDQRGCGWYLAYEPSLLRALDRSPAVDDLAPEQQRLLRAAVLGDTDDIRASLAAGVPADVVAPGFPYTPLTVSVSSQCALAVDLLLDAGADPDLRLPGEDPPLAVAVLVDDVASVRGLLDAGADPDASTAEGVAVRDLAGILGRDHIDDLLADATPPSVQS